MTLEELRALVSATHGLPADTELVVEASDKSESFDPIRISWELQDAIGYNKPLQHVNVNRMAPYGRKYHVWKGQPELHGHADHEAMEGDNAYVTHVLVVTIE